MGLADAATSINPKAFTGAKPHTHQTNLWHLHPAIVKRLVPLPNFVNWKWQLNKKHDAWTKVPYQPRDPTKRAATNDKGTWGTYTEAVDNVVAGKADGIGFCLFETNICAFDIDDCRDLATGEIEPVALALIRRCGATYVEKTVSGTGLRIIGLGGTTYVNRKQKVNGSKVSIESYRYCARYITISGMTLDGVKPNMPDLGNIDALITDVVAELDGRARQDDADPDDEFVFKPHAGSDDTSDAFLPGDLIELIEKGVPPQDDLSAAFHHAVCWLAGRGWSADRIEARIAGKPIVPERFANRLGQEIARCLHNRKIKAEAEAKTKSNPGSSTPNQGPQGAGQGSQQAPPKSNKGKSGGPVAPTNSEEFLALTFIDRHEADLRFVSKWGQWFRWDGSRWELEETLHAFDLARLICREAANACNKTSVAKTVASAKTVAAVERLAKADRKIAATFEQWDTDPNKLNTGEED
jgi:D5 N terminal like